MRKFADIIQELAKTYDEYGWEEAYQLIKHDQSIPNEFGAYHPENIELLLDTILYLHMISDMELSEVSHYLEHQIQRYKNRLQQTSNRYHQFMYRYKELPIHTRSSRENSSYSYEVINRTLERCDLQMTLHQLQHGYDYEIYQINMWLLNLIRNDMK